MGDIAKLKQEYIRSLQGLSPQQPESFLQHVRAEVLERWKAKFYRVSTIPAEEALSHLRLVNHFSLGADPELLLTAKDGSPAHADDLHFSAGLVFGSDNNGRLLELRPAPSRFALRVLSSIFAELHWMAEIVPGTKTLLWRCGAYTGHDGLGGHVHFGRKKPKLFTDEVMALDRVTHILSYSGLYPLEEMNARRSNTPYGRYGDTRPQRHGYEYRTLPSYLASPWQAYLSLVLAKLAVHSPETLPKVDITHRLGSREARTIIRNMLATFKDLDDDARIATAGLAVHGIYDMSTTDFKKSWGIESGGEEKETSYIRHREFQRSMLIPPCISGTPEMEKLLYNYIVFAKAVTKPKLEATWPYREPPPDMKCYQLFLKTRVSPGLGEVSWNLMTPKRCSIQLVYSNHTAAKRPSVYIGDKCWEQLITSGRMKLLEPFRSEYNILREHEPGGPDGHYSSMWLTKDALSVKWIGRTKELLTCGAFPIYKFGNPHFNEADWLGKEKETGKAKEKVVSRVLYKT